MNVKGQSALLKLCLKN